MIGWLQHDFIQNAFLAGTIVAILAAVVGYMVVLRAQAFAAHALSHIGFAGATGAALLGISSLVGMLGLTIVSAMGMSLLGKRIRGRDVDTGMVLAFALGLGVLFLRIYTASANEAVGVLFGSILSITQADVMVTLYTSVAVILLISFLFRPLLFASIDPEVAEARGVPVRILSVLFMLLLAITVAEAVQVVGILLVFALLVAPAATAQHLTNRPLRAIALSIGLSLAFTWGGLILALVGPFPVSFFIATLASISYFLVVSTARIVSLRHFRLSAIPAYSRGSSRQGSVEG